MRLRELTVFRYFPLHKQACLGHSNKKITSKSFRPAKDVGSSEVSNYIKFYIFGNKRTGMLRCFVYFSEHANNPTRRSLETG